MLPFDWMSSKRQSTREGLAGCWVSAWFQTHIWCCRGVDPLRVLDYTLLKVRGRTYSQTHKQFARSSDRIGGSVASICRSVRVGPERVGDLQDCRRRLSLTQTHLYAIPPICRSLNGLSPQLARGTVSHHLSITPLLFPLSILPSHPPFSSHPSFLFPCPVTC